MATAKPLVVRQSDRYASDLRLGTTLEVNAARPDSASINVPHGEAPDPDHIADGDFWSTDAGFFGRVNGVTVPFGGGSVTGANPTATASDTAVNGSAPTFMRSDAAPAVQKGSSSQFGIVKVDGTTITESGGVISAGAGTAGSVVLLQEVTTSGTQANVTFSSIAATYRDLLILVRGRSTVSGTFDNIRVQFNGDTAANYDFEYLQGFGATAAASAGFAVTSIPIGQVAGATAPANYAGSVDIYVYDYRGTTFNKQTNGIGGAVTGTSGNGVVFVSSHGGWRSTAAINAVKVFPETGSFVNGSIVSLYGRY